MIPSQQSSRRVGMLPGAICRLSGWHTLVLVCLLAVTQSACKLVIIVPEGGKVVSSSGQECLAGERCVIEVTDTSFDQTFTAMSADGYTFLHWKKTPGYFCGNKNAPCELTTTAFPGTALMQLLETDKEYHLEPVFSTFDDQYWTQTLDEIADETFNTNKFLYSVAPDVGGCDAGVLTEKARQRARKAVNQVRALHGLAPVAYDGSFDTQAQEASLVQAANSYLSHFPDPGDACYSQAAADGARTSNLIGGPQSDPAKDVFGWTNDNGNLATLAAAGHRRWILFPQLNRVAYGQVAGSAALKVFDFDLPQTNTVPGGVEFVAMPYRTYPYVLVSKGDKPTPWSISMIPSGNPSSPFDYFSSASVTVTEIASGDALAVHSLHTDTDVFGLANFLSWMVDGWDYDTRYSVTIRNVRMPGGGTRDVEYPVLLDRFNLVNLKEPLEETDSRTGSMLQGSFNTPKDSDSYAVSLSGTIVFDGASNFSNQAFFIRVYDDRKRLVKSADDAFTLAFAAGKYTVIVSPCDEDGLCYRNVQTYTVTFQ